MHQVISYCNHCPECIHCELEKDQTVFICEECGEVIAEDEFIYDSGEKAICEKCKISELKEQEINAEEIMEIMENERYVL